MASIAAEKILIQEETTEGSEPAHSWLQYHLRNNTNCEKTCTGLSRIKYESGQLRTDVKMK